MWPPPWPLMPDPMLLVRCHRARTTPDDSPANRPCIAWPPQGQVVEERSRGTERDASTASSTPARGLSHHFMSSARLPGVASEVQRGWLCRRGRHVGFLVLLINQCDSRMPALGLNF